MRRALVLLALLLAPALHAATTLRGGSFATIERPAALPANAEEWEAFLSLDGGAYYAFRITPHLDVARRTFTWVVPNVDTTRAHPDPRRRRAHRDADRSPGDVRDRPRRARRGAAHDGRAVDARRGRARRRSRRRGVDRRRPRGRRAGAALCGFAPHICCCVARAWRAHGCCHRARGRVLSS